MVDPLEPDDFSTSTSSSELDHTLSTSLSDSTALAEANSTEPIGSDGSLERAEQLLDEYFLAASAEQSSDVDGDAAASWLGEPSTALLDGGSDAIWGELPPAEAPTSLIVIDPTVEGWQELVASAPEDAEVLVLDGTSDPASQINEQLAAHEESWGEPLSSMAIVAGEQEALLGDPELLESWVDALSDPDGAQVYGSSAPVVDADQSIQWWSRNNTESLSPEALAQWQQALDSSSAVMSDLANRSDFSTLMQEVFGGAGTDPELFAANLEQLQQQLSGSGLNLELDLRSDAELQGHLAAYAAIGHTGSERVYVNAAWLQRNPAPELVVRVLLEELGHALDERLNPLADSPGDEGKLFAALVLGQPLSEAERLSLAATNDHATISIEGVEIALQLSVNAPPVNSLPGVQTVNEDTQLVFSAATSNAIRVSDANGNLVSTALTVTNGTLSVTLGSTGATISAGASGSSTLTLSGDESQINAALDTLVYQGNANFNGSDTLTVVSTDSAGTPLSDTDTVAITVSAVNDAPVPTSSAPAAITVNEDSNNTTAISLGLSSLAYAVGGGSDESSQSITTYTITGIPSFIAVFKADGRTSVNANDTVSLSELQGLTFKTIANGYGTGNLTWTVKDDGGTDNGGVDTLSQSLSITVTAVNDAPIATGSATLAAVLEDSANPAGDTVANLFFGNFNDSVDSGSLAGVAITANAATSSQGKWQWQASGSCSWTDIPTSGLSDSAALLLSSTTKIRFLPSADWNGTPGSLTTRLVDNSLSWQNTALDFDGDNDYVAIPNTTALPSGNSKYTLEAWIKPDTTGPRGIVGWGPWGATNHVNALRLDGDNRIVNYWWHNDLYAIVGNLADGVWHHVAATFDGTTRKIYLDGVLKASDTPTGHNVPETATNVRIGSTNNGEYFDGGIDNVGIWNIALSQSEITVRQTTAPSGSESGLVAFYNFNEGSGTATSAAGSSCADLTGTLTNGPLWSGADLGMVNGGSINVSTSGGTSAYSSATILLGTDVTAVNDAPVLSNVPATGALVEDGAAITLAPTVTVDDVDLRAFSSGAGNWTGAVLSLSRQGGANASDVFGVTGSGDTGVNFSGSTIRISTTTVGSFTNTGGTLSVTISDGATTAQVNQLAQAITYTNTRQSLAAGQTESTPLVWTINDGNTIASDNPQYQGSGGPLSASVIQTITLTGVNDAPMLTIAPAGVDELVNASVQNLLFSGNLQIADMDVGNSVSATQSTPRVVWSGGTLPADYNLELLTAANALTLGSAVTTTGGTVTIPWTYDPAAVNLDWLAAGETLTITYPITVIDSSDGSDTKDLVITITGANDGPTLTATDVAGVITEGITLSDSGSIAFADLDLTDRPTATEATKTVTALKADGTALTLSADQQAAIENAFSIAAAGGNTNDGTINWTYSISEANLNFLATGEVVTAVFTVTVDDGNGGTAQQDVTLTITGANDGPTLTATDVAGVITEGITLSDSGSIAFADLDLTDR
ncbi:VCBS domain-containing protein, partial [Cyanobium sp. Alchichica 3B3-8F6]|uniref:LamG-like jellyroll fold domain-containing protein n=1 Tax=Cyanobium sp. Alchichica 3B3-8F6 TaxID=2823696 RepID=UPI0020CE9398